MGFAVVPVMVCALMCLHLCNLSLCLPLKRSYSDQCAGLSVRQSGGPSVHDSPVALCNRGNTGAYRWIDPGRSLCAHHLWGKIWGVGVKTFFSHCKIIHSMVFHDSSPYFIPINKIILAVLPHWLCAESTEVCMYMSVVFCNFSGRVDVTVGKSCACRSSAILISPKQWLFMIFLCTAVEH